MGDSGSSLVFGIMKDAVCEGKTDTLQKLLDRGFNVNHKYPDGSTLLYHAFQKQQKEIIQILLQTGANVHKESTETHQCGTEILKIVLKYSPYNSNHLNNYLHNLLQNIRNIFNDMQKNKSEVTKKLREFENDDIEVIVNTCNIKANSLLLIAFANKFEQNAYELMNLVVEKNIEIFQLNHLEKIKKYLSDMVDGFDYIGFNFDENKYFSIISDNNNLNILTSFLTLIERYLQKGYSKLLFKACQLDSVENVEKLIIRARDNLNKNVCQEGMPSYIKNAIVTECKSVDSYSTKLISILMNYASWEGVRKFVIMKTHDSCTPLYIAAANRKLDIVKLLLKYGAHFCIPENDYQKGVSALTDPQSHIFLEDISMFNINDLPDIKNSKGLQDVSAMINARNGKSEPILFNYLGKPNNKHKIILLDLIHPEDVIEEQMFIL